MPKERAASDQERLKRAEEYMAAAREHSAALFGLPDEPSHYPLAFYLAGLALECMFRAYSEFAGAEHDAGHDLRRHAENGMFFACMPEAKRDSLQQSLNEVKKRWLNNHRYRSLAGLRSFLTEAELYRISGNRTIKGDIVRSNWTTLGEAAIELLAWGIKQWNSSKERLKRSLLLDFQM